MPDAHAATTPHSHIHNFLQELTEHLAIFVPVLQREFQPMYLVLAVGVPAADGSCGVGWTSFR
jgi:hypothetical protein